MEHLILDVNGALALDGQLLLGVTERLAKLTDSLQLHLLTADTHGRQHEFDRQLGLTATILSPLSPLLPSQPVQKAAFVEKLGADRVAAIGNGHNDAAMLKTASLGIAVLGPEGLAIPALLSAGITDALDLLLHPDRLKATLRL